MPDRVDPQAGWFNLGDRKVDELPSLEDSRITQPRSSESQGMQARVGELITLRYPVVGMPLVNVGATNQQSWYDETRAGGDRTYMTTTAASSGIPLLIFAQNIVGLPVGGKIHSYGLLHHLVASSTQVTVRLRQMEGPTGYVIAPVPTSADSFFTPVGNGAWTVETQAPDPSLANKGIILDNAAYWIDLLVSASTTADDLRVAWVQITYSTPA